MATPELAIAKATLSATLFRADPTSLSRPSVEAFFSLLTDALAQCSRPNVQKCKVWIVENVAPSTARTTALAKYSAALSKSLQDDGSRPSLKRRRLHLLYVLNDVFHHFVVRKGNVQFAMLWENVLPSLIASAAAFNNCPKHKKKLADLIQIWFEKQYLRPNVIIQLEDALDSGVAPQTEEPQVSNASIKLAKDAPFTLPSFHGDHSVPWYDLPATTWLPHLTPNSTKAMYPDQIRPIQLASGPADKVLVTAVQDLLGEVERMFSKEQKWDDDNDLNELGERVVLDEITGDIIGGETYYGWSRRFCEKMKERKKKGTKDRGRSRSRSRSYSRGRSRSSSRPAHKRPRVRDSRSRSPSRSRSRSYSRGERSRRRSSSYSRSRSRSRGDRRRSYSRSPTRSPPRFKEAEDRPRPPPIPQQPQGHFPPVPPPGDFPLPPPPPVGYQGPWPPPPPPHMAQGWFPPNPAMMGQMMGWNVPPPPPPQNGYQGRGRGGGFRGRGRGGYDRGRGW
ncbi:hypothetical protein LB507_001596 [Fusarium sp. FIESC RH6]|nr:hypothetical protein LB507_001596 [Fusarium sp. FIESC RH6]